MVRTIEQILGMHPMNQEDGSVAPMYDAFTSTPDFTPYDTQSNLTPLTLGASGSLLPSLPGAARDASARLARYLVPASARAVFAAWMRWGRHQHFGGSHPTPDFADPAQLNRFDWYATHGWRVPYPGDRRILTPSQVKGSG
jgi:hypothetical protein